MNINTQKELRRARKQAEIKRDQATQLKKKLVEHENKCLEIYSRETKINQELLQYFNGHKEYYLFDQMAEEMKREQRQLVEQFEKMDATLSYGQRELDLLSETLYEKELNLLREETTKHGQNDNSGSSNTNGAN